MEPSMRILIYPREGGREEEEEEEEEGEEEGEEEEEVQVRENKIKRGIHVHVPSPHTLINP